MVEAHAGQDCGGHAASVFGLRGAPGTMQHCKPLRLYLTRSYQKGYETWEAVGVVDLSWPVEFAECWCQKLISCEQFPGGTSGEKDAAEVGEYHLSCDP